MSRTHDTATERVVARAPVVIRAENLSKSFGDAVAVSDLSFVVPAGGIVGLLGPNGAGKTTTINMLTTLTPIDAGTASVAGFDVTAEPEMVRRVIGLAGQSAAVDERLTARENLRLFARLYKLPKSTIGPRIEELIERFRMEDFADRPAGTFSGGERRRLDVPGIARLGPRAIIMLLAGTTGVVVGAPLAARAAADGVRRMLVDYEILQKAEAHSPAAIAA